MLKILWLLFVAFIVTISLTWILDHNGTVTIDWLGYETKTDILTALLIALIFTTIIFIFSYFVTKLLLIRFPQFFKHNKIKCSGRDHLIEKQKNNYKNDSKS